MNLSDQVVYFGGVPYRRTVWGLHTRAVDRSTFGLVRFAGQQWKVWMVGEGQYSHWTTIDPATGMDVLKTECREAPMSEPGLTSEIEQIMSDEALSDISVTLSQQSIGIARKITATLAWVRDETARSCAKMAHNIDDPLYSGPEPNASTAILNAFGLNNGHRGYWICAAGHRYAQEGGVLCMKCGAEKHFMNEASQESQ